MKIRSQKSSDCMLRKALTSDTKVNMQHLMFQMSPSSNFPINIWRLFCKWHLWAIILHCASSLYPLWWANNYYLCVFHNGTKCQHWECFHSLSYHHKEIMNNLWISPVFCLLPRNFHGHFWDATRVAQAVKITSDANSDVSLLWFPFQFLLTKLR